MHGRLSIYVASSWRNKYISEVVNKLREAGHDVYDFRNPPSGILGLSGAALVKIIWNINSSIACVA